MSKSASILVAEDDVDDRLLIDDAFRETNVQADVQFVEDGEELMACLKREGRWAALDGQPYPVLILLDLNMPRLDGREALERIKADASLRSIPVVVLSTSRATEDLEKTYSLGANSFVTKPGSFDELLNIVRTLNQFWVEIAQRPPQCAD